MAERWCSTCKGMRKVGHEEKDHAPALFGSDAPIAEGAIPKTTVSVDEFAEGFDLSPGRARRRDYPTSNAGASDVSYRAGSQKARLLAAYQDAGSVGLTDEEACTAARISLLSCYWKRCNELRQAGVITATGEQRRGRAGVERMVCRISGTRSLTEAVGEGRFA